MTKQEMVSVIAYSPEYAAFLLGTLTLKATDATSSKITFPQLADDVLLAKRLALLKTIRTTMIGLFPPTKVERFAIRFYICDGSLL